MKVLCVRACVTMRMMCACACACACASARARACACFCLYSQWSYIATRCLVVMNLTFLGW